MTCYALTVHPDDVGRWKAITGRDETRPYDMPPLKTLTNVLESAERNNIRVEWRELDGSEER